MRAGHRGLPRRAPASAQPLGQGRQVAGSVLALGRVSSRRGLRRRNAPQLASMSEIELRRVLGLQIPLAASPTSLREQPVSRASWYALSTSAGSVLFKERDMSVQSYSGAVSGSSQRWLLASRLTVMWQSQPPDITAPAQAPASPPGWSCRRFWRPDRWPDASFMMTP